MPSIEAGSAHTSLSERYRVLLEIGRTLTGTLSLEDLYRTIYRETARVVEASGFYISLYDEGRDLATVVFYAEQGEERRVRIAYRGSDSEVIRTGEGALIRDRSEVQAVTVLGDDRERARSAISAPLRFKGRCLGAISTQSYEADAYTEDDLELLQGIGDVAAVAIQNARQFAELKRRRREADQIEEIGRALTSSLDPHDVLRTVIDAVLEVVPAAGASMWLLEGNVARVAESQGEIRIPEGSEWRLEGWLETELLEKMRPVLIGDLSGSGVVPEDLREILESGSGIGVPLVIDEEVAGILSAGNRDVDGFTEDDVHVLQRLANQASVALENARLHVSLQAMTLTDPLTDLPNRRHLEIHMDREVAAARRGREVTLVIFDVDDFKVFNDTEGHVAGDEALRAFAAVLRDENREMNLVARYGGDEFVSVLTETDEEGARTYVERVEERIRNEPFLAEKGFTVSAGVASFDPDSMDRPSDLIRAADQEMYERKGSRPDRT